MKMMVTILGLMVASSTVFASNKCDKTALEIAQMTMDSKAKAYLFDGAAIIADTLKVKSGKDGSSISTVTGYIYKAEYTIEVGLDSSCGVETVKITEN